MHTSWINCGSFATKHTREMYFSDHNACEQFHNVNFPNLFNRFYVFFLLQKYCLRGLDTPDRILPIIHKGDKFSGCLIAFLQTRPILKYGLL